MRNYYLLIVCFFSFGFLSAQEVLSKEEKERREQNIQAGNPFSKFGYKTKVATLSKGKYLEVHDLDSIVIIGTTRWHVYKNIIVGDVIFENINPDTRPIGDVTGRWFSPDPLSEEFPSWSPYNFCINNPVRMVDPDGRAPLDWYKSKKTGNIIWREGSANLKGYTNIGTYTDLAAGTGQNWHLSSNGTFRNSNTGQTYGNNETVVFNSSTGQTLTSKQNWVQRNIVAEVSLSSSMGIQLGVKVPGGKLDGGIMTTEIGSVSFDFTSLSFNGEFGDGAYHNFAGGSLGFGQGKSSFSLGSKGDYSFTGNDIGNGDFDWNVNAGKSFGPGVKNGFENLGIRPSAKFKSNNENCYCLDIGSGFKALMGVDLNLKIGIKKDE